MKLQTVIYEHRFGQTVYNFHTPEDNFPSNLTHGQIVRLAEYLHIADFEEDEETLTVVQEEDEFPTISMNDMEYILTGNGELDT